LRTTKIFQTAINFETFKQRLLAWGGTKEETIFMDSNQTKHLYNDYEAILAVEAFTAIKTDHADAFEQLKDYQLTTKDWLFGYLGYDLKNDTEAITSSNEDCLHFPELYFIQPKKIWLLKANKIEAHYLDCVADEIENDFDAISNTTLLEYKAEPLSFSPKYKKEDYEMKAQQILQHIQRGDLYEVNFCQEFYSENTQINPIATFQRLNSVSKAPFACFLKLEHFHALGASPERFLKKKGNKLISQPIKGTAKRGDTDEKDEELKTSLSNDLKEVSENVMIVDLVRNDLSKTAKKSSVEVEEFCKIYTYEQVHQMVSTLVSEVKEEYSVSEILKSLFPMGSMTGAPKRSAMEIAERYESTKRGLYSGAIGYITPEHDFDFNVVIRTLLYNSETHYLSYMVGSALTAKAKPEQEYEECLVKGKALQYIVNDTPVTKN